MDKETVPAMSVNTDSIDWSAYPPDRVEGLKYFYLKSPSDEAGPATEEELKMLCLKWHCVVDMRVDNFLFWFMRKLFRGRFKSNKERFQKYIPKIFDLLERRGMEAYLQYQADYGHKNREFLRKGFEWRQLELQRLRYLDKLEAFCLKWSWSDTDDDSNDETFSGNLSDFTEESISSINTVINAGSRFANYLETQSNEVDGFSQIRSQEEVNTQSFVPNCTSTQK